MSYDLNFYPLTSNPAGYITPATSGGTGASPSWDQTLAVNRATSRIWEFVQTGLSQFFELVTPDNYGNISAGKPGRFGRWIGDFDVNAPDTRHNIVASDWSYNYNPGGSPTQAGESAFAFKTETYFNADGTHLMEFHRPEIIDDAGVIHRIWSFYAHRPDGFTYVQAEINQLDLRTNISNVDSWFFGQRGNADGATILTLGSGFNTASTTTIRLQNNLNLSHTDLRYGSNAFTITVNGAGDFLLNAGRQFIGTYLSFSQFDYFGDSNVYIFGKGHTSGKGFIITDDLGTNFLWVNDQYTAAFGYLSGNLGLNSNGFISSKYLEVSATYLITDRDHVINATSGTFTITLPTAVWIATLGKEYWIKNSGIGVITVATTAGQLINGSATITIGAGLTAHLKSTNAGWITLGIA